MCKVNECRYRAKQKCTGIHAPRASFAAVVAILLIQLQLPVNDSYPFTIPTSTVKRRVHAAVTNSSRERDDQLLEQFVFWDFRSTLIFRESSTML